jgi:hypothetical protein
LPPFDGSRALNRSNISIQPLQVLTGYPNTAVPERVKLSKSIIIHGQNNSIMIIFSKKRVSEQSIFRMIETLIKTMPPRPQSYFYDTRQVPYFQLQLK